MATYKDMRQRIANELARDDLSTEIGQFIKDAILFYQNDFFALGTKMDSTAIDAETGSMALPSDFNLFYDVRWVRDTTSFKLEPIPFAEMTLRYMQIPAPPGDPTHYALDLAEQEVVLWPVPNADGTLVYRYQYQAPAPTSDISPSNGAPGTPAAFWMNEAEPMVRAYAKFLINTQLIRDDEAAKVNAVAANEYYKAIRRKYENQALEGGVMPDGDVTFEADCW